MTVESPPSYCPGRGVQKWLLWSSGFRGFRLHRIYQVHAVHSYYGVEVWSLGFIGFIGFRVWGVGFRRLKFGVVGLGRWVGKVDSTINFLMPWFQGSGSECRSYSFVQNF